MTDITQAPSALPLLGHALPLLLDRSRFLSSLPQHGDLVWIRIGPQKALVVTTAELSTRMLRDDRTFDKGGVMYDRIREITGNGVSACPHADHRRQRRLIQPSFQRDRIPTYMPTMYQQATRLTDTWHEDVPVRIFTEMKKTTARTTLSALFSSTLPDDGIDSLVDDLDTVVSGMVKRSIMPGLVNDLPTPGNRKYQRARERVHEVVIGLIAQYRHQTADNEDLMSVLVATRDTEGDNQSLSDIELKDQVVTFLMAGTETTAGTLSWALHLLTRHSDIDARLYAEAIEEEARLQAGGKHDPARLPMARKVILETLRLYPPAPMITRLATQDTELGGHRVPRGTTVIFAPFTIQHRPDLYPDPDAFRPDRWPEHGSTLQLPRSPFSAFGGGARQCIGDTFGLTHATVALSTIAARWRLHRTTRREPRPGISLTLVPPRLTLTPHRRPTDTNKSTPQTTHGSLRGVPSAEDSR
ncbi:cytochrome P450 [Streptomyces sp. NPDC001941]|uniref:cytochrome P450 n=1 Tax=Streptomyces sp. NPDC001941 TaxID=3154659 RepID=UPI00331C903C